jgi:hypothetical protein
MSSGMRGDWGQSRLRKTRRRRGNKAEAGDSVNRPYLMAAAIQQLRYPRNPRLF